MPGVWGVLLGVEPGGVGPALWGALEALLGVVALERRRGRGGASRAPPLFVRRRVTSCPLML
jgi:hypothetical protein